MGGVGGKVVQPFEVRAFVKFYRRLRVRAKQLVARTPELRDGVRTGCPVEIADPAPPVDEVEKRLAFSDRQLAMRPPSARPASACSWLAAAVQRAPGGRRPRSRPSPTARSAGSWDRRVRWLGWRSERGAGGG